VARQDIYRILNELQQLGLVEKIITTPTNFTAIPIQEAASVLLERRIKETADLQARARELIQEVATKVKTPIPQEKPHFVLISEREALINRIKKAIATAQESIDLIGSAAVFPQILFVLAEKFNEAMKNGVKIRYVICEPEDANTWPEIVQAFTKNPSFKLRTLPNPPDARYGLYDKKEVFIATFPSHGAFQSPALWSNNSSIITVFQEHFERAWITAMENPNHKAKDAAV